jgi:hypothetical protein
VPARAWEKNAVAMFDRLQPGRHLDDSTLAGLWVDTRTTGERPAHPHLDGCAACRSRYAAFAAWLVAACDDATAEADEAFTPERLAAQQSQILRRLEAMERPARVIKFPRFAGPVSSQHSGARRWIAAAAAAGLVIGLVGGQILDLRHRVGRAQPSVSQASSGQPGQAAVRRVSLTNDEAVLMELGPDAGASAFARIPEPLRALDGLTPHARDYDRPR